ncbi:MAG: carboxypeptidase-like regulatory domain-containing protein [Chitinophagaceae bacterium]|nr:carboxypeptidase-like regulatory domain-containing protein [Chitinophagaceae bacterium]
MRIKCLIIITVFTMLSFISVAQTGKIEGKVIDSKSGQPLTGVSVLIKGTNKGVSTNIDGYYLINADASSKITLVFSYNGAAKEIEDIEVSENKIVVQNIVIEQNTKTGPGVTVRSTSARKETTAALITFQKNTNTVASVISAESIRRSPDKNTGEVLKRVPGASVQEGTYLVIRGLSDRYNQAMLNGILLSSTEPDRKTFSYDIFPSPMIDNIIINKAFVPELPGEWAGGLIQVQTKDIPAADFFNIQFGTGFNTQTIGKEFCKHQAESLIG